MPELPEVETVMRGLRTAIEGHKIVHVTLNRHDLRWPFPANLREEMLNQRVVSFSRRAKYILMRLENKWSVLFHLGMSGRMLIGSVGQNEPPPKHEHVIIESEEGVRIGFVDPRRFGAIDLIRTADEASHPLLTKLGLEPLSSKLDGPVLQEMFATKRHTPIKTALLDQRYIAGLGNIYVCEALFKTRIHPERTASSLTEEEAHLLARNIQDILTTAIASGGSSLRDYVQSDGTRGGYQDLHLVYGREGEACRQCSSTEIQRLIQSGRSTFYCPSCQK
ncbi:bifunctional DNA-formamidopyrimidine glycosylase/DNA-(apurinic or apyrimidinic site) lyase [Neokomagataea tanensis]|uniref:Formamidopyrimidine-DNA glycosylase n=1 Tax=Neokomagataea tanensis TaxID=661191 RepID=A0A4Y6VAI7_9PROT|nr:MULTISPECIES: bifunctional DNA-formamidopyrimidine glycosylase/DNA-(apurinic or apyrimidinic site) lyase [Neokomagataea]QDH25710.1 bifunctional DNA-formamidopyrimidine glycosylase/DNA-(apurinic or apyrimidinic site) lyase [Neokomagataea tanensis]